MQIKTQHFAGASLLLLASFTKLVAGEEQYVTVDTTTHGSIVGTSSSGVDTFRGIQYATVGARFSPSTPVIVDPDAVVNATEPGPECFQGVNTDVAPAGYVFSEECLYLNIWRPSGVASGANLTTMFWIHGGSFRGGSGLSIGTDGRPLVQQQNVIVVTINYRLGVLGFMPTSIFGTGGMNGILDQINALRWVKDNIAAFGGNPDDITVFGESSGSYSVCLLSVSPLAKGLFHRAIMQSLPCAYGPFPGRNYPYEPILGFGFVTSPLLASVGGDLARLFHMPAADLMSLGADSGWPTLDRFVLPKQPRDLYEKTENINPKDVMVGSTNNDDPLVFVGKDAYLAMADFVPGVMLMLAGMGDAAADAIIDAYAPAYKRNEVAAFAEFVGDFGIRCPSREFVGAIAPQLLGDAYLYNYAHFTVSDVANVNGIVEAAGIDDEQFATHASEIILVFGTVDLIIDTYNITAAKPTDEDRALITEMMARWANFAKTGNPNVEGLELWTPVPKTSTDDPTTVANMSTLVFTKGRGRMVYPEEQVKQCSAFPYLVDQQQWDPPMEPTEPMAPMETTVPLSSPGPPRYLRASS